MYKYKKDQKHTDQHERQRNIVTHLARKERKIFQQANARWQFFKIIFGSSLSNISREKSSFHCKEKELFLSKNRDNLKNNKIRRLTDYFTNIERQPFANVF